MRITPLLVARPPKARAVDVTAVASDLPVPEGAAPGLFRAVLAGTLTARQTALDTLLAQGVLVPDQEPSMWVYRVVHAGRRWVGVFCGVETSDIVHLAQAQPTAVAAAEEVLRALGRQVEPIVVHCQMPEGVLDLYIHDTNERPAYHFVASDGATHSAWIIRNADAYVELLRLAEPRAVLRGAAQLVAVHRMGVPAMVILTRDLAQLAEIEPSLAPRSGLFIA